METPAFPNVIDFAERATALREGGNVRIHVTDEHGGGESKHEISVAQLYPLARELNPQLADAQPKLDEALGFLHQARIKFQEGDRIVADDFAQRLVALLPELFLFDRLSEGFRGTVLASFYSLVNLEGLPIGEEQAIALKEALEMIRSEPFVGFDAVVDVHERFVAVGLKPDPKALDIFGSALEPTCGDDLEESESA
jgi:hypothetical protein